jgi:hypothetical protein
MDRKVLAPDVVVHRLGGGDVENLQLKPKEATLCSPGISVLIGGDPEQVRRQVRRAFPNAVRLLETARTIGTTTVEVIRRAGFDVIADPTRHFPNHARIVHRNAAGGFSDVNLRRLSQAFTNSEGS